MKLLCVFSATVLLLVCLCSGVVAEEEFSVLDELPVLDERVLQDAWIRAERSLERELDVKPTLKKRYADHSKRAYGNPQPKVLRREVVEIWKKAEIHARAVDDVTNTQNITRRAAEELMERAAPRDGLDANVLCRTRRFTCNNRYRYRTIEGFCNNLQNTDWGMAVVRLERLLDPVYGDQLNSPRQSVNGGDLPLARFVSTTVIPSIDSADNTATHITMFFGQFLNHDITSTPHRTDLDKCCQEHRNNADCMPINIPTSDPQFGSLRIGCMEFARSHRACGNGARQQMNQNTAFIDGSQIYGSTNTENQNLRTMTRGLLKSSANGQRLPENPNEQTCTPPQGSNLNCFSAGDNRVNENPGLSALHLLFMKEHNRIATELARFARYDDETLFQEARRIVIAELQNIVYHEFLPLLIGSTVMSDFNLPLGNEYSTYDSTINPSIVNSFSTAAYRFGHSMIAGIMQMNRGSERLADNFNNPQTIYNQGAEAILVGGTQQSSQAVENFLSDAVTRQLFREQGRDFGLDLAAINIQRGRDHGLPSYNAFRELCSVSKVRSFSDLSTIFRDSRAPGAFRNAYSSVDDIDLWPGLIAERPQDGALLGPVASCLLGVQFNRLKFGDRYFFTHERQVGSFGQAQIQQLRTRTLASVMCDNLNIRSIQPNVFKNSNVRGNGFLDCTRHPKLDLSVFV